MIHKKAKSQKEKMIDEFRQMYNYKMKKSIANFEKNHSIDDVVSELQVYNIYNHIKELENININPVSGNRFIMTIFSIFFQHCFFE